MKMIRNIVSALALTLLLPLGLTAGVGITTIEASKYGVLPGRTHDSGPWLTALLREARALSEQGDSLVIRFAPGEYAVHEESLPRKTIFISNHDHHDERAVALLLRQLRHTRIEAEGVTLLAHGRLLPVVVSDCSDLTISGLTIPSRRSLSWRSSPSREMRWWRGCRGRAASGSMRGGEWCYSVRDRRLPSGRRFPSLPMGI